MTFQDAVIKRRPFWCTIMGMPFLFDFDSDYCQFVDAAGCSRIKEGKIILDPDYSDNALVDTAFHEVLEIVSDRMQWELDHRIIQQMGVLFASALECECKKLPSTS